MSTATTRARDAVFDEAFLRKLERLDIVARKVRAGVLRGERRSTKRGQSVEFADFRLYSPGDDLRRVDWNVYARTERAFLKLFVEEEDRTVHVLLDASPSMDWGGDWGNDAAHKLTWGQRAAAALGYIALAGLDRVAVATIGADGLRQVPVMRGTRSLFRLLDFLADTTASPEGGATDLDGGLAAYAARARNPGPLFLVSDLLVEGGGKAGIAALASRGHEPNIIQALAPDELDPGHLRGELKLVDRETGTARELTVDDAALNDYGRRLSAWQGELASHFGGRGWPYLPISTATPFEDVILNALRRGGMVR